ncbi:hypothetical protein B4099_3753 [Heyndrickxia coagulans]|jgi:hypothetical protein|uniref:Uncharacterized protein n=1 Tax=Heyndrickxia coagulans TaxID=1398 RepID=A0A150K3P9_HEYCO|nr:hypothetical protein BSM4216_0921 [Bacillus smithii]KYC64230.1 hypothetical protein B4099_3753 [Heyndrickxia coagulans]
MDKEKNIDEYSKKPGRADNDRWMVNFSKYRRRTFYLDQDHP